MGVLDYILLGAIVVAVILAVHHMRANKGCCGDCSKCATGCENCRNREENRYENHEK